MYSIIRHSKFKLANRSHSRLIAREGKQEVRRDAIVCLRVASYENNNYRGLPTIGAGFFLNIEAQVLPIEDYRYNVEFFTLFIFLNF